MILIDKDGNCKCENCLKTIKEKDLRYIKWPGIDLEQAICKSCGDLFYKWKNTDDRIEASKYYDAFYSKGNS